MTAHDNPSPSTNAQATGSVLAPGHRIKIGLQQFQLQQYGVNYPHNATCRNQSKTTTQVLTGNAAFANSLQMQQAEAHQHVHQCRKLKKHSVCRQSDLHSGSYILRNPELHS